MKLYELLGRFLITENRFVAISLIYFPVESLFEPRCKKIGLWGFRPDTKQTGIYNHRR